MNVASKDYTFTIVSEKYGTFLVTAPAILRKRLEEFTWCVSRNSHRAEGRQFDVMTNITVAPRKKIVKRLHRMIWELTDGPPTEELDHIDGNALNNSLSNLRAATRAQNARNLRARHNNTSGYLGVCWSKEKRRWKSEIRCGSHRFHLGYYKTAEDAARVRDSAASNLHGEFAFLNFGKGEVVEYGFVYRQNSPAGWKGRKCKVIALSPQRRDWLLRGEVYTGESLIGIEFDNGEMACVQRQSIVPVRSRMGWAALRNAGKPAKVYRTKSEAQVERYAKARGETV